MEKAYKGEEGREGVCRRLTGSKHTLLPSRVTSCQITRWNSIPTTPTLYTLHLHVYRHTLHGYILLLMCAIVVGLDNVVDCHIYKISGSY